MSWAEHDKTLQEILIIKFFVQNSLEENQFMGFLLLAINIPHSLPMTRAMTAQ